MERMQSMFNNPFSTKVGMLIERGTSSTLEQEDWAINMEIVDAISSYEDGAKDAIKAFRKRLSSNKCTNQLELTLSVLETCVKNCGIKFHILVMSRDFCNDVLVKLLNPKMNIPIILQQRVLSLIQEWANTFKNNHALVGVVQVYNELLEQGHEFPKSDNKSNVPIITPKRTHDAPPPVIQQPAHPQQLHHMPVQQFPPQPQPTTGPINPSPEQSAKLRSELNIVLENVKVMSEMLTDLVPGKTERTDLELLQELHRTCKAMQQRVVELVERIASEEITSELLRVNDDLNNVFLRYERFERYRENSRTTNTTIPSEIYSAPSPHVEPPPSYSTTEPAVVDNLIDLGPTPEAAPAPTPKTHQVSDDFANLNLDQMLSTPNNPASYPSLSDDLAQFDSFSSQSQSNAFDTNEVPKTQDVAEIEQWLQPEQTTIQASNTTSDNNFETTDEFNAFLSERISASDQLQETGDLSMNENDTNRQRKLQQNSQAMFGL